MVAGLILAAGASSRMGRPKAGVPVPGARDSGDTFLLRLGTTLLRAGLPHLTIVTGAAPVDVRAAWPATDRRVRFVQNDRWADGQLTSLRCGLDAIASPQLEAVMMTLVDVPLVGIATVRAVLRTWRATGAPIVRPGRGELHGHPVLLGRSLFEELRTGDLPEGAKTVVHAHLAEIVQVDVDDPGAFRDFDTPSDLEEKREMGRKGSLSPFLPIFSKRDSAADPERPRPSALADES